MNSKAYKVIFMALGIVTLGFMIYKLGFHEILGNIEKTGGWFIPIIGSWLVIYGLNALAFRQIIEEPALPESNLPFSTVLRLTITGYAINYVTPFVALGGEPYRIMELKKFMGIHKATSSVLLYGMMHVFSHIVFWVLSILLILAVLPLESTMVIGCVVGFILGILIILWFLSIYKKGFTVSTFLLLQKLPFVKKFATNFLKDKSESLHEVDDQIRMLYEQRKSRFLMALLYEILARVVTCAEIYFTAVAIGLDMTVSQALIISSASSLFANIIFFFPMQLGVREGGLALALRSVGLPAETGIFIGIIMRIREIVWIIFGFILMRVSKR
ncbi:lysylphosphatidylglycerol synthase transmembrane domain-containing protein [Pedobacter sp. UYP1]|uniref:lysylphosphatidylglycerol synthase transmembrane domain-containing protein n=1 Tax=Pedobacter sp. UYP1 TaxID=1756396 RepID=UPI0033909E28